MINQADKIIAKIYENNLQIEKIMFIYDVEHNSPDFDDILDSHDLEEISFVFDIDLRNYNDDYQVYEAIIEKFRGNFLAQITWPLRKSMSKCSDLFIGKTIGDIVDQASSISIASNFSSI